MLCWAPAATPPSPNTAHLGSRSCPHPSVDAASGAARSTCNAHGSSCMLRDRHTMPGQYSWAGQIFEPKTGSQTFARPQAHSLISMPGDSHELLVLPCPHSLTPICKAYEHTPVQIVEEARQPAHHELVVLPPQPQLLEQHLMPVLLKRHQHLHIKVPVPHVCRRSARCVHAWACRWKPWAGMCTGGKLTAHLVLDVALKSFPVLDVQLLRVVVGWLLGAHVVDGPGER